MNVKPSFFQLLRRACLPLVVADGKTSARASVGRKLLSLPRKLKPGFSEKNVKRLLRIGKMLEKRDANREELP